MLYHRSQALAKHMLKFKKTLNQYVKYVQTTKTPERLQRLFLCVFLLVTLNTINVSFSAFT